MKNVSEEFHLAFVAFEENIQTARENPMSELILRHMIQGYAATGDMETLLCLARAIQGLMRETAAMNAGAN
jgi:hypothetical protein